MNKMKLENQVCTLGQGRKFTEFFKDIFLMKKALLALIIFLFSSPVFAANCGLKFDPFVHPGIICEDGTYRMYCCGNGKFPTYGCNILCQNCAGCAVMDTKEKCYKKCAAVSQHSCQERVPFGTRCKENKKSCELNCDNQFWR